jgi:hypothetical protein
MLFKEKFGLSENKYVRIGQRVKKSLLSNRIDVYDKLYGNLVTEKEVVMEDGTVKKDLKFKSEEVVNAVY